MSTSCRWSAAALISLICFALLVDDELYCCCTVCQVECEHQLSLERDRTAAVARQRDAAESRLLAAEARAAALEVRLYMMLILLLCSLLLQLACMLAAAARAQRWRCDHPRFCMCCCAALLVQLADTPGTDMMQCRRSIACRSQSPCMQVMQRRMLG